MSERAGLDLSTVQIVASMGAAVTGAVLTSYIGDGGTIVGTALGAGTSTAGFAVYKHYLGRTKEKVAPVIAEHARQWTPTTQASSRRAAAAEQTEARTTASPDRAVPSDGRTRPDLGQPDRRWADAGPAGTRADFGPPGTRAAGFRRGPQYAGPGKTGPANTGPGKTGPGKTGPANTSRGNGGPGSVDAARAAATETMLSHPTARMGTTGHNGPSGPNGPDGRSGYGGPDGTAGAGGNAADGPGAPGGRSGPGDPGGPGKHGRAGGNGLRGRPRWVVGAVTTAAVFLLAMLVITLIEFGTGKPISASLWGHQGTGTTLGNVTGARSSSSTTPTHTPTPTVSPSGTQSTTPNGVGQTAPQPSSSATVAPSPSSVPSVSNAPAQTVPAQTVPAQNGSGQTAPAG